MSDMKLSNYEIHKQLFAKLDPPTEEEINAKFSPLAGWFASNINCKYYMLMCREDYDFTVFHFTGMNYKSGIDNIKLTLENRGTILDIAYVHGQDAYECWIKTQDGETKMFMLFCYDWGVVDV